MHTPLILWFFASAVLDTKKGHDDMMTSLLHTELKTKVCLASIRHVKKASVSETLFTPSEISEHQLGGACRYFNIALWATGAGSNCSRQFGKCQVSVLRYVSLIFDVFPPFSIAQKCAKDEVSEPWTSVRP